MREKLAKIELLFRNKLTESDIDGIHILILRNHRLGFIQEHLEFAVVRADFLLEVFREIDIADRDQTHD
ncbi:MAG: hypothetical protein BWY82_00973 [Verrucomicrobia bacterium ADurb.Bin474]|nr:MAG: hypothetical protein BWY82_00973 [Verrucomicrobia bacterium ADurb.Bin474]